MKIALVGSAPSSVALAPYKDKSFDTFIQGKVPQYPPSQFINEEWEIWACSPGAYGAAFRMTRFFELHRWEPGASWFSPEYCQFLREFRGPVYTGGPIPEIKNHVVFDIDRVEGEFSPYFLTSSLSHMLAWAIIEIEQRRAMRATARAVQADLNALAGNLGDVAARAKQIDGFTARMDSALMATLLVERDQDDTIGMWGVDMSAGEEWEYQRPGCQFFILEALRRKICVYLPPESDILHPQPIYGLSEWDPKYIKATVRARELGMRQKTAQANAAEQANQAAYLAGAIDNMNYFIKTHLSDHGLPHGIFLRHQSGGLGNGVTPFGARIVASDDPEHPTPINAPADAADAMKEAGQATQVPQAQPSTPASAIRKRPAKPKAAKKAR